jgi:hypothetical protein
MDWSVNTIQFLALKEVHDIFKAGEIQTFIKVSCTLKSKARGLAQTGILSSFFSRTRVARQA